MKWPLKPDVIEELKANVNKKLVVATRKLEILEKKLEECKKKNMLLPPEVCDTTLLNENRNQVKECNIALMKIANAETIQSWKQGDRITCISGNRRVSGSFEPLDFRLAHERLESDYRWYNWHEGYVADLEVVEVQKDQKILAKSRHGKTLFLGVPLSEDQPIVFFPIKK